MNCASEMPAGPTICGVPVNWPRAVALGGTKIQAGGPPVATFWLRAAHRSGSVPTTVSCSLPPLRKSRRYATQ